MKPLTRSIISLYGLGFSMYIYNMFRTPIAISSSFVKINHSQPIFTIGSCFSDCMGHRFDENKFEVMTNPFGTVYNPVSISTLLNYTIKNQLPATNSYTKTQGLFANFDFHSSFSATEKGILKKNIETAVQKAHKFLPRVKWMIITLGTAYVYQKVDDQAVVSNCHKLPAKLFIKKLLTQKQIINTLSPMLEQLLAANPNLNIILTVSPVRHINETLVNNTVSKATLRISCETLANGHERIQYFPSYEIMIDDLRDYRFYKSDMIHPSDEAEQYIWDQFSMHYFDPHTLAFLKSWDKIKAALNHKPFNPASPEHQRFLEKTIEHLKQLEIKLDITKELKLLKGQLTK